MSLSAMPQKLQLVRGSAILGTIDVNFDKADLPWYSGVFNPTPEFDSVRDLFEHELELLRANTEDDSDQWDAWEAAHEELHGPGLRLQAADRSYESGELLIHIDGKEAWWRNE